MCSPKQGRTVKTVGKPLCTFSLETIRIDILTVPNILSIIRGEVIKMADYKKMYLTLLNGIEEAIDILVKAEQECEEIYINSPEAEIHLLKTDEKESGSESDSD